MYLNIFKNYLNQMERLHWECCRNIIQQAKENGVDLTKESAVRLDIDRLMQKVGYIKDDEYRSIAKSHCAGKEVYILDSNVEIIKGEISSVDCHSLHFDISVPENNLSDRLIYSKMNLYINISGKSVIDDACRVVLIGTNTNIKEYDIVVCTADDLFCQSKFYGRSIYKSKDDVESARLVLMNSGN